MKIPGFTAQAAICRTLAESGFRANEAGVWQPEVTLAQSWGGNEIFPNRPCHCYGGHIWCCHWSRYSGYYTCDMYGPCSTWPLPVVAPPLPY